jgi:hypothetical protein
MELAQDAVRPVPTTFDRQLFQKLHGLREGLGWIIAAVTLVWLGGVKGRRAGIATALAPLTATYLVQHLLKPVFRRQRPFVRQTCGGVVPA